MDLLPAQTLGCLEVRQPERLAREAGALTKGSVLEDLPAVLARFRSGLGGNEHFWFMEDIGIFGLFFSPEMINEAGRIQGGAVALTGLAKDGTPQVVGLLQSGDSNLPGLYLRAYLTFSQI